MKTTKRTIKLPKGLQRRIEITPSWDKRDPDPKKNYGINSNRIFFYVIGEKGAVQFVIGTMWFVESARRHLEKIGHCFSNSDYDNPRKPMAWDLGYHAKEPCYDGHEPLTDSCDVLGGERCYYDGSTLNAEEWLEPFIAGGTAWLWPKLEEYYRYVFEDGDYPKISLEEVLDETTEEE